MSVRTVELPPFSETETRLLLTEPLHHSPMWEREDPRRPRFDAAFRGEGGIERVHAEAAGWPHLVQLIAETAVDLLSDTDARRLDANLLERALDQAIVRGDVVPRQLLERECALRGERDYLRAFRTRDIQPPPADEAVYTARCGAGCWSRTKPARDACGCRSCSAGCGSGGDARSAPPIIGCPFRARRDAAGAVERARRPVSPRRS